MRHPITDDEREVGLVTLRLLPEQAEAIEGLLAGFGACLSPPARFKDELIRCVTFLMDVPDRVREEMRAFLEDEAIPEWWHSPVPALGGRTPEQTWKQEPERVLELIDTYRSASFT